jgi:hypothetical protein
MATLAVDCELGGLRFFPMNCSDRLREGKDRKYGGGDIVALSSETQWRRIHGYLGN